MKKLRKTTHKYIHKASLKWFTIKRNMISLIKEAMLQMKAEDFDKFFNENYYY